MGLKVREGYEAFNYLHEDGKLKGAVLMHVDDFNLTGTNYFVEEVLKVVDQELTVS